MTEESLEELYGNVSDDIIIQIAEEQNLRFPEDLREGQDEDEDFAEQQDLKYEMQCAIDAADYAVDSLNAELRVLQKKRSVQLKYARLATAIDMWIDDGLFDALTHLQINKAQNDLDL